MLLQVCNSLCLVLKGSSKQNNNDNIDDVITRNDDRISSIGIVPVHSQPFATPTTTPTLRATIQPTTFTSTGPNVCPAPESSAFQSESTAVACVTNADCKGKYEFGVPTCCIYPLCICGLADSDPSGNVLCVDDESIADDIVNRVDDDLAPATPISIGSPSPKTPTPLPGPTSAPTSRPFPDISCVSTPSSAFYQTLPQNRPCQTNAHCADFHGADGCCLSPNCICGIRGKGSSGQWQCFEAPQ